MKKSLKRFIKRTINYFCKIKRNCRVSHEETNSYGEFLSKYPQCSFIKGKQQTLCELMVRLEALMEGSQLFLSQHVNVMQVINKLGTNRTYLSVVLAEHKGFYGYVNCKRLKFFCGLLESYLEEKYKKKEEDALSEGELTDVGERIHGKTLLEMITQSGFSDIRAFKRALDTLKDNDYVEKIKKKIFC